MSDRDYEAGMSVRREVLGDAHVDRAIERTSELTAPFQDFITRFAWGAVWSRPGLDRATRSAITLAVSPPWAARTRSRCTCAVRSATASAQAEIGEVLLHTAVYAGVPAANEAFAIAQRVLEEEAGAP